MQVSGVAELVRIGRDDEATEELLRIPGLLERLEEAEKDIAEGRTVPVEELRRKP